MKRLIHASVFVLLLTAILMTIRVWRTSAFPGGTTDVDNPEEQTPVAPVDTPILQFSPPNLYNGPPDQNPYSEEWLAANHGLVDNIWTAQYEQGLLNNPSEGDVLQLLSPEAIRGNDVRLSNAGFNSAQSSFQIAINPTDSRYAIAAGNDSLAAGVAIYRTTDSGNTWDAVDAPIGASACCNPGVAYAYEGSVYVSVLDQSPFQVYVIRSTDNGATWGTPTIAPATSSSMDRQSIIVDNGAISSHRGRVYLTYSFGGGGKQIAGYYSDNQGTTWDETGVIGGIAPINGYQQASEPYVAPDGTIYVGYQEVDNSSQGCAGTIRNWLAISTNGGTSFTQSLIGAAPIKQGGACLTSQLGRGIFCVNGSGSYFRSRSHPIVSGDPFNSAIVYVVYSGGDLEQPYACASGTGYHSDTLFTRSTDGGATWSMPLKINGDPPGKDQYFPWLDTSPNGTLWAGWLDRRADPNNYQQAWWQAYSNDRGTTWHEFPVSDLTSLPATYIGDYSGLAATSNLALGVWWDSRIKSSGDPYTEPTSPLPACTQSLNPWETAASLPVAVYGPGVASDGVYVYAVGGQAASDVSSQVVRYSPRTHTWNALSPLPTPVANALVVYAEGKLYVMGGNDPAVNPTNLNQVYNIADNTWTTALALPAVRQQMGGGYFNGKIYAVGGYSTSSVSGVQDQTWEYTIASNSWVSKAPLPAALAGAGSGVLDGHLYILGGRDYTHDALNTTYDYDIAADTWVPQAGLLNPVNQPGSAVYDGRIWIMGGGIPFSEQETTEDFALNGGIGATQIFDPAHNSWLVGPTQNVPRSYQGAAVVDNQIYSVGGWFTSTDATVEVTSQAPLRILIIASDANLAQGPLQRQLLFLPSVGQVDVFSNGSSATPSLATLQAYDVVVPFSNSMWQNSNAIGNVLADYLDSGGVVVGFNFDWSPGNTAISGRWQSGGYSPFNTAGTNLFSDGTLGTYSIGHPLMAGVQTLNAYYRQVLTLASGATQVAAWNDSHPLIAFKGHAVGVNAYVGEHSDNWSGDYARLIVNAGYWLRRGVDPCSTPVCQGPTVIHGSIDSTDSVQAARLNRSDPASSCGAPTACGLSGSGMIHYDVYPFFNNTFGNQCVTVSLDPKSCTGPSFWLHSSAYLGNYDPVNKCADYLADIGGSPETTKSYSFIVPGGQAYSIVVNEETAGSFCPAYSLSVLAEACPAVASPYSFLPLVER